MKRIDERFWPKVKKSRGCWLWIGAKTVRGGYGQLRDGKKRRTAHRTSWELNKGPIPKGLHVLHHCDNPACVRPDHLFLGTQADNNQDCCSKGRQPGSNGKVRGDNHPLHKLTWAKVRTIRASATSANHLAKKYGIHPSLVYRIRANRTWKKQ